MALLNSSNFWLYSIGAAFFTLSAAEWADSSFSGRNSTQANLDCSATTTLWLWGHTYFHAEKILSQQSWLYLQTQIINTAHCARWVKNRWLAGLHLRKKSNVVAHYVLKFTGPQLALLIAQSPVLCEACEVRRRDVDPGSEVLETTSIIK